MSSPETKFRKDVAMSTSQNNEAKKAVHQTNATGTINHLCATGKLNKTETPAIVRHVIIKGTHIRIKSVFNGTIPLEKALSNLVSRKMAEKMF